jgi:hypothetical protein
MKKLLSTLFGSALVACLLFAFIYFSDQARAYEPPAVDGPELALLLQIPPEFTPADITSSLYCPRLETKTDKLALLSLWAKTPSGLTFAHGQFVNLGKDKGSLALIIGPKMWILILQEIIGKLEPRGEKKDITITGPSDLTSIVKLDAATCNQIAASFLIKIVESGEGATATKGPGEGGTWPKEEVLVCADGARWMLLTAMNGHPLSRMSWTKEPTTVEAAKELPEIKLPELLPCSAPAFAWEAPVTPPAPTTKQCTVPIATECPR